MTPAAAVAHRSTVLWDLDGTILDSSRPVLAAWAEALTGMGLDPLPADELHRVIGPPMQHVAHELLAERGRSGEDAYDEVVARFRAAITEREVVEAVAYDGVVDVVRAVHATGRRMAVVTSKPMEATVRVLPALGIVDLFVHVEAPPQAAPEEKTATMARAVGALGIDPDDTVMVGDRHHDVVSAAAHGVPTVGVTWGGHGTRAELDGAGAALVVDVPDELRAALLG